MRAKLGTVERAYEDGYAAAIHRIDRLRVALDDCRQMISLLYTLEPLSDEAKKLLLGHRDAIDALMKD